MGCASSQPADDKDKIIVTLAAPVGGAALTAEATALELLRRLKHNPQIGVPSLSQQRLLMATGSSVVCVAYRWASARDPHLLAREPRHDVPGRL